MKKIIIVFAFTSFTISLVWAALNSLSPAVSCFVEAYSKNGLYLTEDAATELCSGTSNSLAPIECYQDQELPTDIGLTDEHVLYLCSGATMAKNPVNCFLKGLNMEAFDLSLEELVTLCRKASSYNSPLMCFEDAFFNEEGPKLDLEMTIELCSGS